jgi:hypothetical protein
MLVNDTMRVDNVVLHTNGRGFWSREQRAVSVVRLEIGYVNEDNTFGELCVYFDTSTWDPNKHGLIYTDELFMQELRRQLDTMGLASSDVDYSEQGMQGDNYVSCDVGEQFLTSWDALSNS